jgi:hypothetical protein
VVVMVSALATGYVATWLLGFTEPAPDTVADITGEAEAVDSADGGAPDRRAGSCG